MSMNVSPAYVVEIPSKCDYMPEVIDKVVETLYALKVMPVSMEKKVRICMQEAIVNAIRHGNKEEIEKKVRVEVSSDQAMFTIKICDEGEGMENDNIRLPDVEELNGRGIHLMRHFMDEVFFDKTSKCLELRKSIPQKQQGEH